MGNIVITLATSSNGEKLTQPLCCVSQGAWRKGSVKSYKSISRDLNVPVSTVHNIIKRFTARGTVANLPGRGWKSKIYEKIQQRIFRMVDKEP